LRDIYPHANTVVCIEESKLLKRLEYEILYNTKNLRATLNELNDINYFHTYKNADPDNYAIMLDGLTKATFGLMKEIAPDPLIWRIFALYYDIHNMKLAVKERILRERLEKYFLDYGSYPMQQIRSATVRESDDILRDKTLTRGLFDALRQKEMQEIDFILDKTYFRVLKEMSERFEIPEIVEFVTDRIDLYNFSCCFQSRAMGSPEGYFEKAFSECGSRPLQEWLEYISGSRPKGFENFTLWKKFFPEAKYAGYQTELSMRFDVLADNYLINKTKVCKLSAFGIEPICAYFFNKLIEIKNIRILLMGKENDFASDEIIKRMRIPYEL